MARFGGPKSALDTVAVAHLTDEYDGNREITGYEYTFGKPVEEQMNITAPNNANRRILSETEFAIALSQELGGKFDAIIDRELGFLEAQMEENGALTFKACKEAEEMLLPLQEDAKAYKIILRMPLHTGS